MNHSQDRNCLAASLADRGVLRISGPDAERFLQGLLTTDLANADKGNALHAGLLNPQGKILFDVFVARQLDGPGGDGFLVEAPKESLAALTKRLSLYRLRADVEISETGHTVVAAWDGVPAVAGGAIGFADPRLPELGWRVLLPEGVSANDLACATTGEDSYHARRIALGVPEGGRDYAFGDTFPHEALFDQLNGIDFKKGCFVGQEVVSRMEHRGSVRKRVVPVEGDGPLQTGIAMTADELPVGTIGTTHEKCGLALLRLDRVKSALAKGTPLSAGNVTLTLRRPAFATFDVPAVS